MLQVNGAHGCVARISDGADSFDSFVGANLQDVDLVGTTCNGLRTPDVTVAASLFLEIEVRRVCRQLEDGDLQIGDFHVHTRQSGLRCRRCCDCVSVSAIWRERFEVLAPASKPWVGPLVQSYGCDEEA